MVSFKMKLMGKPNSCPVVHVCLMYLYTVISLVLDAGVVFVVVITTYVAVDLFGLEVEFYGRVFVLVEGQFVLFHVGSPK